MLLQAFAAIALLAAPAVVFAQGSATRPFQIGIASVTVPAADAANPKPEHGAARAGPAIVDGLRSLGWVEGRNIRFVWKSAEGDFTKLPSVMEEFVRIPVDVLVVFGPGVDPAMKATRTIPIVMSTSGGIANVGMVKSLGRPETNVTGVTFEAPRELLGKRLELLKRAAPNASRIAILEEVIRDTPTKLGARAEAVARALGLSLVLVPFNPDRVAEAFAQAVEAKADAILVADGVKVYWRDVQVAIHGLAAHHRIPVMHATLSGAETGGLMAYGFDIGANYRRMPYFIDRILRGAKPSDLPIEQPARMELVVNKSAARAIGLGIPAEILLQADRVID